MTPSLWTTPSRCWDRGDRARPGPGDTPRTSLRSLRIPAGSARLPSPTSQAPTGPFSFAPGVTPPARPSAASTSTRYEPFPAFRLLPALPAPRPCLWPTPAPGVAQAPGQALWQIAPIRTSPSGAWNNAVRTRGVFTHRDDFQKPACAERGLVRTVSQPFSGKYK